MGFTSDPSTNTGLVRILISDTDPNKPIYGDEAIEAVLAIDDNVFSASATLLRAIAVNQALLLKVTSFLGSSLDGTAVARELRLLADKYLERAQVYDSEQGNLWDWANTIDGPFAQREILIKAIISGEVS